MARPLFSIYFQLAQNSCPYSEKFRENNVKLTPLCAWRLTPFCYGSDSHYIYLKGHEMAKKQVKIGAYLRVSTDQQDVKSQKEAVRIWAKTNHVPITEIRFYEDKKSGTTTDRPQLQRLIWAVDKGRIDTVVVFRLDRLARNLRDGLSILADLADKGIRVVSISENIDFGSSTGRLIASILLAVASFERDSIVERIKAGMAASKASGKHIGRPQNKKRLEKIRKMRNEGMAVIKIAEKLECSRQNIYSALAKTA